MTLPFTIVVDERVPGGKWIAMNERDWNPSGPTNSNKFDPCCCGDSFEIARSDNGDIAITCTGCRTQWRFLV